MRRDYQKKISYENRVYESVDFRSLSSSMELNTNGVTYKEEPLVIKDMFPKTD